MRTFLKIFKWFWIIVGSVFAILSLDIVYENINTKFQLKNFIDNGVYIGNNGEFFLYEVEIEQQLTTPSVTIDEDGNAYSQTPGDIFIYRKSTLDENYPNIPLLVPFVSYYFGGHAGIIADENNTIETNGTYSSAGANIVDLCPNNIFYNEANRDAVGLRVKAPEEDINTALDYFNNAIGMPYNYTFIFNKANSYYCTDLVARGFGKEAGLPYNLDVDGIATSVNDLIISKDTFITYYMIYKGNEKHLYYAVNK